MLRLLTCALYSIYITYYSHFSDTAKKEIQILGSLK